MRTAIITVSGISMTIGLAIFGFVRPTLGIVLLFGGAAAYVLAHKNTIATVERLIASKTRRQSIDEHSATRQRVREQFDNLSPAEKEAVKHVKQNGHISAGQVATYLADQGFTDSGRTIDSVRGKTPFLLGSFSGEFSINPELKELLDELLNPPLLNPGIRALALFIIAAAILASGYLFRRYGYPTESNPTPVAEHPALPPQNDKQPEKPKESVQSTANQTSQTQNQPEHKQAGTTPTPKQILQSTKPTGQTQINSGNHNSQQQNNSGGTNTQQQSSGNNSPNITQLAPCDVAQTGNNNTATVNCASPSGTELAKFGAGIAVQVVSDADSPPSQPNPPRPNPIATGFWLNNKGYIATCLQSLHGHDGIGASVPIPPLLGQLSTVAGGGITTGAELITSDKETNVAILHVLSSPFERSMHGIARAQKLDDQGRAVGAPEVTQEQYWVPVLAPELAQSGDEVIRVAFTQEHEIPVVNYDFGHITRMGTDPSLGDAKKSYRIYTSIPFKDSDCGAPVINNAKTVVGMVNGSDGRYSVAVPSTYILDVLKATR